MAKYGFFINNGCVSIAESEEEKNFLSTLLVGSVEKTLTDEQFNNAKNYKSYLVLNNDAVEENLHMVHYLNDPELNVEEEKARIKDFIQKNALVKINNWLSANPLADNFSYWNDYKNKLEAVDVDSISFPLGYETFQEWFNNQTEHPQKSPLQLP